MRRRRGGGRKWIRYAISLENEQFGGARVLMIQSVVGGSWISLCAYGGLG